MRSLIALAVAVLASGCGLTPKDNARLDSAHRAVAAMQADASVERFAPADLRRASETLADAQKASDTLQDPALIDHLAYMARQRAALATERARRIEAERSLLPANLRTSTTK
ncbi:MAG TPA: DUF4398 domain-containing protein [Usitatibacter sp.]|nr:DUF4398 domain-containing protein [Usitatibacter sp.]